MNATRRGLNRFILLVVALVLLAIGALLIVAGSVPGGADAWATATGGLQGWLVGLGRESAGWGAVAALAVIALLLIVLASSAVRGRRRTALQASGSESSDGRITVTDGFASDAVNAALAERDEILSARVHAGEVGSEPVLHLAITPRQNTSPRQVADYADTLVGNLAAMTGRDVPTFISIHSGLRAKLARETTRVN